LFRNESDPGIREKSISALASRSRDTDIPFRPSRVVLQDLLGTPALVDMAGLRDAVAECGSDPTLVNPTVPVHLVVDHSLNVEHWGFDDAARLNYEIEQRRNAERFNFLAWCDKAFNNLAIIPSGTGILHQINLERLTTVITTRVRNNTIEAWPDTLVGTDSHTTMINAIGVLGWGVGGIEAEAAMLGKPLVLRLPEVIRVQLEGTPDPGILATDIALALTERLRTAGVVGALLEFMGPSVKHLSLADRATISNMAPEYGATAAMFPIDDRTIEYLDATGRSKSVRALTYDFSKAMGLWRDSFDQAEYDRVINVDMSKIVRCLAGPKHPHQLVPLNSTRSGKVHTEVTGKDNGSTGFRDGSIVIAAITSCTNTSNPRAVIAAGLIARNARRRGLQRAPWTKTSFAPGSKVVFDYMDRSGLKGELESLGFNLVGFGCTTCNGMSGSLVSPGLEEQIKAHGISTVAVLSGNRNFEGRIHNLAREAYIMSPPLVVAYAIAGNFHVNLAVDSLGTDSEGIPVYLKDIWPSDEEIERLEREYVSAAGFAKAYSDVPIQIDGVTHDDKPKTNPVYDWSPESTYIRRPPYWNSIEQNRDAKSLLAMRPLVILGDHVTTDHISPSGEILPESAAGVYLLAHGVPQSEFNSYGTRRGNHEVGIRATFANPRLRNEMIEGTEGSFTRLMPDQVVLSIFDAAREYQRRGESLVIVAGREYGSGSSRDWAAKGPRLLGVRVVLAEGFERIHRSNLAGMGILPVQFSKGHSRLTLGLTGLETFDLLKVDESLEPRSTLQLRINHPSKPKQEIEVICRLDNLEEVQYFREGGLLPHLLNEFLGRHATAYPREAL
jgi:2-methylcitrate dehydratase (2-methyl-trans-aconitate forming)